MSRIPERSARFMAALRERILVLDGAMGTMIQARNLTPRTSAGRTRGLQREPEPDRPDVIQAIHERTSTPAPI
jgi:5-methyltetrahydrofolate--homocysteine methyltransferase